MVLPNDIASKALDAYKSNPLLTALFLLNLTTFIGFGWFVWDKETKVAKYILLLHDHLREAQTETVRVALQCQHPAGHQPQIQYVLPPQTIPQPPRRPK